MNHRLVLLTCLLAASGACSGGRDPKTLLGPNGGGTIVVDARLIVGLEFPPIDLTTTQATDQTFSDNAARLFGATLAITTAGGDTVIYSDEGNDGYRPSEWNHSEIVAPHTTYFLHVRAPDGRFVTAQTTTPDSIHVREWLLVDATTFEPRRELARPSFPQVSPYIHVVNDSVYSAESNQLIYQDGLVEARFDRGGALAVQMAIRNLSISSPLLIDADFVNASDLAKLDRSSSSPPLDAPDGYVRLPWAAVWYQGLHKFFVYSVDRNWYDIARSVRFYSPAGLGFGTNAGDDLEKPIFHIEGGIGLFGSASMEWTGFKVDPKP